MSRYRNDPVGYAKQVLGIKYLWAPQVEIAESLLEPPYRTMVLGGHALGKTFLGGWVVNWWYDTRDPGVTMTTAPIKQDVMDLTWGVVRMLRREAGLPGLGARTRPEMFDHETHWARGWTADKAESFQGRHFAHSLFLFEEAVGIDPPYWITTGQGMFKPGTGDAWLAYANPTDTSSQCYAESTAKIGEAPKWRVFSLDARLHPNIRRELRGLPPLFPNAVRLQQLNEGIEENCELVYQEPRP